jgi:hypothetical protein
VKTAERIEYEKRYKAEWWQAHKEEMSVRKRAYRVKNREQIAAKKKEWKENNREREQEQYKRRYAEHPLKQLARARVGREVRMHRFPAANTMVCDICQEALAAHWHHHNGYGPGHELDVIAVCRECHTAAHEECQS